MSSGILAKSRQTIHSAVQPVGISNVTAYLASSLVVVQPSTSHLMLTPSCFPSLSNHTSTASQCYTLVAPSSGQISVIKYVGIASSDAFAGKEASTALSAISYAKSKGYTTILAQHTAAWDGLWDDSDIIIPGEKHTELQLATRASLFHMLSNVREGHEGHGLGDNSIAPSGLTSDSYAGFVCA